MSPSKKKDVILKLIIIILGCIFWMIYRLLFIKDNKEIWNFRYCFEDKLLTVIFLDLTNFISQHLYIRDFLILTGSVLLDILFVTFLIVFIAKGHSWKPLIQLFLFYGFRGMFIQSVFLMEIYDTYLWGHPGFPSLVVPFGRAPDFFYSGHAGCALTLGLILSDLGYKPLYYFGLFLAFFEGFVMTVTRTHYSIDIIFGILCAHYMYILAGSVNPFMDKYLPICGIKNALAISDPNLELKKVINSDEPDNERGKYDGVYNVTT